MKPLSLDEILIKVGRLPALPEVVMELMRSFDEERLSIEMLARKLSRDLALVMRIMRVANSPFYGLQGRIGTVQEAIVTLGLTNIRALVVAAAIIGQFPRSARYGLDWRVFWRHAIGVASGAKVLCAHTGQNEDTAFICGLLHDIGRLVLAHSYPQHYAEVITCRAREDLHPFDAERLVLGLDHAAVGAALAARWNFPQPIVQAVGGHHLMEAAEGSPLACLTHVADVISHALDLGGDSDGMAPVLSESAWAVVRIEWKELKKLFAQIEALHESTTLLIG